MFKERILADSATYDENNDEMQKIIEEALNDAFRDNEIDLTIDNSTRAWKCFMEKLWEQGVRLT